MQRLGNPGENRFPYEVKWDIGTAIIYATSEAQAIFIFKVSTMFCNQQKLCIRLMSDNE